MVKKSPFPTQTALLWPWQWPQHLGKPDLPESFAPGIRGSLGGWCTIA